jgi:hypothetical protein
VKPSSLKKKLSDKHNHSNQDGFQTTIQFQYLCLPVRYGGLIADHFFDFFDKIVSFRNQRGIKL